MSFAFGSWHSAQINHFKTIQKHIDCYLRTPIAGGSKYAAANAKGLSSPNVYSRAIATITKYLIQTMSAETGYARKITKIFEFIFGFHPQTRLRCGPKGIATISNAFRHMPHS